MIKLVRKFLRLGLAFLCDQYLVLFFILTTCAKFVFLYDKGIDLNWWNGEIFNNGVWLDIITVTLLFSPLLFIRKHKNKLALVLAFILALVALIDTIYYSYFSSLPTAGLINSIGQISDIGPAIGGLMQWWFVGYFLDILFVLIFKKQLKSAINNIRLRYKLKKSDWRISVVVFVVVIAVFIQVLLIPGAAQLSNTLEKGYDTVSTAHEYGILVAHGLDITRYINQLTTRLSSQQQKDLKNWVNANKPQQVISPVNGAAKGKNVIMLQVESLGGFVINQKFNGKEITPNLNELSKTSQFFPNDRFVIGAGHTSDTDFVANTSFFPLYDSATFIRYGQNNFSGLPKILTANGYSAYAYHGFNRNFWDRNVALNSLGYQKFYAADNYPAGAVINMGLNDGDFLSKSADYIQKQPKPSFSYLITLSSHVPFTITDQTKGLGVNPSDYPDQVGGYLEDINYTDRMIGNFFAKLKSEGLYDDSLILVYGDHTPVLPAFSAGTVNYDPATVQEKEVPLMIKLPNETPAKTYRGQGTHMDIMPTIIDLLGIKTDQLMFGESLFADKNGQFQSCPDQLATFKKLGDCKTALAVENEKSAEIIRYNQFDNFKNNTLFITY